MVNGFNKQGLLLAVQERMAKQGKSAAEIRAALARMLSKQPQPKR